ncbi:adenosylcobinamide amidohydrolase [Priestia megaterium]|nr:adenosylcobinamide amidohydrolase [Priestia megaterium]
MKTSKLFKAYSSGVIGAGVAMADMFYNRFVHKDYDSDEPLNEYKNFLKQQNVKYRDAIGLMTAVRLRERAIYTYKGYGVTISSIITAGVGNAVDIISDEAKPFYSLPGTINMFFFIEGNLTEAAFLQVFITATEAKTKMMNELGVVDPQTKTIATGTSTDSICVAASQTGNDYEYAGSMTALGQAVGKLVKISLRDTVKQR